MKKPMMLIMAILLAVLGTSLATAANITIADGMSGSGGSGWYSGPLTTYGGQTNIGREDQEVEPNNATGQSWDLEGFFLEGNKLKMVGGFDFKLGKYASEHTYKSGDIFLATNGAPKYGSTINWSIPENSYVKNTFGYNYALSLDFQNSIYKIYRLTADSYVYTVAFNQNKGANPWKYKSGGTLLGSGAMQYVTGLTNAQTGFLGDNGYGGSHKMVTVDLSFLNPDTTFYAHFTMECGNDDLMAWGTTPRYPPVPEPGTIILLGSGLIGISGYARKKIRK